MLTEQKKITTDAALNGWPDMEAFRKLDASLYPEAYGRPINSGGAAGSDGQGMERDGRPLTNIEMAEILDADRAEKNRLIALNGCCGETPDSEGYCFGIGKCPREAERTRCEDFVAGYMQWLDDINEDESALAAIAARLSVSSPIQSEVCDV